MLSKSSSPLLAAGFAFTFALAAAPAQGDVPWLSGYVFAGIGSSSYGVYDNDGNLLETITSGLGSTETTGGAFDASGDLWTTEFSGSRLVKYSGTDPHVVLQTVNFTTTGGANCESITFDSSGNFYVGCVGGDRDIKKFDSSGTLLQSFNAVVGPRGTDWIELSVDQQTMFYTSEGRTIRRFDVVNNVQLADFATLPGTGNNFALRLLPPFDGSGGLIVADGVDIKRLDSTGAVVQSYDQPGVNGWFAMNLDPNGTSFWAGNNLTSNSVFYRFNIATGAVEVGPVATPTGRLAGLIVKGEITGGNPPPQFDPPSPCGATLPASVGVPFLFDVTASDPVPTDIVTLTVSPALPAGAMLTPSLPATGNPVSAQFTWTPDNSQAGTYVFTFTATDVAGQATTCEVTVEVAECYLLLGLGATNMPLGPDPDDLLLVEPLAWWPVTTTNIPTLAIPNQSWLLGFEVFSQVGMFNPATFPGNPLQFSNGLKLVVGSHIESYPPGFGTGIDLTGLPVPQLGSQYSFSFTIQ